MQRALCLVMILAVPLGARGAGGPAVTPAVPKPAFRHLFWFGRASAAGRRYFPISLGRSFCAQGTRSFIARSQYGSDLFGLGGRSV